MHEHIRTTLIRRNEAEALRGVEPFHSACGHDDNLSIAHAENDQTRSLIGHIEFWKEDRQKRQSGEATKVANKGR
jgi:hypothetical protein